MAIKNKKMNKELIIIFYEFDVSKEKIIDISPFGNGLINRTFLVETTNNTYLLQQINNYVFKDVDGLMNNIYEVTNHLKNKNATTFSIIKTKNGKNYLKHGDSYFRLYSFVSNSVCYEGLTNLEMVYQDGEAFGEFHKLLADLDSNSIIETISNFHNTPYRLTKLISRAEKDEYNRLDECKDELNYVLNNKDTISKIIDGLTKLEIPTRIVHNDPKINNILFDKDSGNIKCVVDLDTIMPGSILFDYGDALRSLFTGENQSSKDSSLLKVNLNLFEAYTKGYLFGAKEFLTSKEIELMPMSIYIISMELAIRFLDDYLDGDKYFKTSFEKENLYRAKNQIALAKDVYQNLTNMERIVEKISRELL